MRVPQRISKLGILGVVLGYAGFSAIWILVSDKTLAWLIPDPARFALASIFKGWFFVAVTSVLLYWLVLHQRRQLVVADGLQQSQASRLRTLQLLETILDSTEDAIFTLDLQGRHVVFNKAAQRLTGKSAAEVAGKDETALFPAELATKMIDANRRVMADDTPLEIEEAVPFPEGERILWTIKTALHDAAGGVIGLLGIARDVTDDRRAREALGKSAQRYRTLLDNLPQLIWQKDRESVFVDCNAAHALALRTKPEAIPGKTDHDFYPSDLAEKYRADDARIMATGEPESLEERWLCNGRERIVQTTKVPLIDGQVVVYGTIGIAEDITERKQASDDLRHRNEELERFNRASIGRELAMIDLKKRVNALSRELGREPPFPLAFERNAEGEGDVG